MSEETVVLTEEQEQNLEQAPVAEEIVAQRICPQCGKELAEEQKFCPGCGTAYVEAATGVPVLCTNCGAEIPEGSEFCSNCGTKKSVATPQKKASFWQNKKLRTIAIGTGTAILAAIVVVLCIVFRDIPVERIEIDEDEIEITEEETMNLSCVLYPENATDKTVEWSTSDKKVATVDQYGRITAIAKGDCVITVKAGEIEEEIDVVVKKKLPDLKALYDEHCESTWADLGDDHSFLSVDNNPFDWDDGDYRYRSTVLDAIQKIHKALGLPDSLYEDMLQTTWSMGKQQEDFENVGIRVTWTYHPDKGVEATYKLLTE